MSNRLVRTMAAARILMGALVLCAGLARAQSGAEMYKAKCAACHGADGHASALGKKLGARDFDSAEVQKESDGDLETVISQGRNKMPAYKTLKQSEIKDLVAYIRTLGKK